MVLVGQWRDDGLVMAVIARESGILIGLLLLSRVADKFGMREGDVEPLFDEGIVLSFTENGTTPYFPEVEETVILKFFSEEVNGSFFRPMPNGGRTLLVVVFPFVNIFLVLKAKRVLPLHIAEEPVPFRVYVYLAAAVKVADDVAFVIFLKRFPDDVGFPRPIAATSCVLHKW